MNRQWWKEAVVYEIYCKSFCDSNGDGIGDIKGVISKLPVLKELGIDCIWFTPLYKSPQADNGYDVADYEDIDSDYGTMDDFKELLDKAHSMGIRVIMDMVLNHTSDEHKWFVESKKSKDNPYRNYYIWQPPKADGIEPNNWGNRFREGNGSAWEFDETTGEYYLHQYSKKMPDLNWEYEPLRKDVYAMLNRWLDMGIDGFRLDIITRLKKPSGFPDTTHPRDPKLDINGYILDPDMCTIVDGIHEILHELYTEVFYREDCMTVGEASGVNSKNALEFVDEKRQELDMVYYPELSARKRKRFDAARFREVQSNWAKVLEKGGWAVQVLSNHDRPRQVSKYGDDGKFRKESSKLLAVLMHTTPGTPFMYQGEEIGMTNVRYDSIDDYNCPYARGDYFALVKNGVSEKEAMDIMAPLSRDNARTPVQWNDKENAGFTTGKPWIKVNSNYKEINFEADRKSDDSIFAFYQQLLRMRKEHLVMVYGDLKFYLEDDDKIIMYTRKYENEEMLVIANYSGEEAAFTMPEALSCQKWTRLLANTERKPLLEEGRMLLAPWECEVYVKAK